MRDYICRKHFAEILILLDKAPMSFNELLKTLNAYPDTLTRRLKEMGSAGLITGIKMEGKLRYELTDNGKEAVKLLKDLQKILDGLDEIISSF
ncbi:MAG TPA: ArsR family transcriptional regulator [Archaeoglobaceae archaeon]|nr:ArsR family transcriptional regulator [Archaeoglobaceae archaeon]